MEVRKPRRFIVRTITKSRECMHFFVCLFVCCFRLGFVFVVCGFCVFLFCFVLDFFFCFVLVLLLFYLFYLFVCFGSSPERSTCVCSRNLSALAFLLVLVWKALHVLFRYPLHLRVTAVARTDSGFTWYQSCNNQTALSVYTTSVDI